MKYIKKCNGIMNTQRQWRQITGKLALSRKMPKGAREQYRNEATTMVLKGSQMLCMNPLQHQHFNPHANIYYIDINILYIHMWYIYYIQINYFYRSRLVSGKIIGLKGVLLSGSGGAKSIDIKILYA